MALMFQLCFKAYFILVLRSFLVGAAPEQGSLYMWIDARQARILLGKNKNNKEEEEEAFHAARIVLGTL